MAKPIIASAISDLPLILDGGGWVGPPGDVAAMSETIRHILNHAEDAAARGSLARDKCIRMYSRDVTERELVDIVQNVTVKATVS